jgi:DNA-directed RNA polymerase specialized sigma24 family protein
LTRRAVQSDVGEFIAARSDGLLRTAYLLTGDRDRAEDLLQGALSRVWSSWSRSDLSPDLTARRELVRGLGRTSRRRSARQGDETLVALERLPRRQRAALVLSEVDRLSSEELADVLECAAVTAARLTARARASFAVAGRGGGLDLVTLPDDPADPQRTTMAQRLREVERRVGARRRRHGVELVASLVVASVAAVVIAVAMASAPVDHTTAHAPKTSEVKAPPIVVGHQLPPILHVKNVNYNYSDSLVSSAGDRRLRVVVSPSFAPQAVTWVTPWTLKGSVEVRVDQQLVFHGGPGPLGAGALLTPGREHTVILSVTRALPGTHLGLAIYRWPRS